MTKPRLKPPIVTALRDAKFHGIGYPEDSILVIRHMPWKGCALKEVTFHRRLSQDEMRCIYPCLSPDGFRWRMHSETEWHTGDDGLMEAALNG